MSASVQPFDRLGQNLTYILADGVGTANVTFASLDDFLQYNVKLCINYGVQLGACLVMLFVTAALTTNERRRTPVFALNMLSLLIGFLRALFLALWSVSSWAELWFFASGDTQFISQNAYRISVAGAVLPLLFTACVNASLVFQAHATIKSIERKFLWPVNIASGAIYLLALGFRFAECVTNILTITQNTTYFGKGWLTMATLIVEFAAIVFPSFIFCTKLWLTQVRRKRMGIRNWNGMQLLLAGGCCTMVIPVLFGAIQFIPALGPKFPEAGTLATTMVALLLPISSLWAHMETTGQDTLFSISSLFASRRPSKSSSFNSGSGRKDSTNTQSPLRTGSLSTFKFGGERKASVYTQPSTRNGSLPTPFNPSTTRTVIGAGRARSPRDSTELDLEAMGVRVNHSYSVTSDRF